MAGALVQAIDDFFWTSSSSEDESDEVPEVLRECNKCRCETRVIPRITDYVERIVTNYNDGEFIQAFRYLS